MIGNTEIRLPGLCVTMLELKFLLDTSLRVLEDVARRNNTWVVAFSGGKDSTLLLHLVTNFLENRRPHSLENVYILYNDTLGELPPVHKWAIETGRNAERYLKKLGYNVKFMITKPKVHETYYWRVLIRGYPAPNYKFRWCIELLKIRPTKRALMEITVKHEKVALLTGLRDDESPARSKSMKKRVIGCSMGSGPNCLGNFILKTDFPNVEKIAPIRYWRERHVWKFLSENNPPWGGTYLPLLAMYNTYQLVNSENTSCKVRFGCWFCTVSPRHCGLKTIIEVAKAIKNLDSEQRKILEKYFDNWEEIQLLDKVRLLIRKISDVPELRTPKNKGYSKLGPLKPEARALILQMLWALDRQTSRELLYGLNEKIPETNKTLRQLFFDMDLTDVRDIIAKFEHSNDRKPLESLRLFREIIHTVEPVVVLSMLSNSNVFANMLSRLIPQNIHSQDMTITKEDIRRI